MILLPDPDVEEHPEPDAEDVEVQVAALHRGCALALEVADLPAYFEFERYGLETMRRFSSARTLIAGRTTLSGPPLMMRVVPCVSSCARNLSEVGTSRMLGSTLMGWPSESTWSVKVWIAFLSESAESAEFAPERRFL